MGILALSANIAQTMSSRDIAELTGKEHKNVKRDCEAMFSELNLDALSFERIYHDSMNRPQTEYLLPFELIQTLITGYSIKLRHAVIQRLNELESKSRSIPQTLPDALRLAADLAEQKAIVEKQLTLAAPKAQAFDNMINVAGGLSFRTLAKDLNVNESVLRAFLKKKKWMQWIKGNMVTMERAERKGWAKTDSVPVTDLDEHGNVKKEYMKVTTLFTAAGKAALELAIVEGELQRKSKGAA